MIDGGGFEGYSPRHGTLEACPVALDLLLEAADQDFLDFSQALGAKRVFLRGDNTILMQGFDPPANDQQVVSDLVPSLLTQWRSF